MAYVLKGKTYSDHSLMDEVIHGSKIILNGIILKNCTEADQNETAESMLQSDYLMAIHNGSMDLHIFPLTKVLLIKFGYTDLQAKKILADVSNVPASDKERLLEPLGLIYGEKIHLIAKEKAKGDGIYNYLLHKFDEMKVTDKTFDKGDFNLQEYTKLSFGVYHGEILDVKLSFDKSVAEEASKYNFHPTQKIKFEKDGSLTVSFKASGSKEIMWHVFKWGSCCKIVAPKSLKEQYINYLQECIKVH